MFGVRMFEWYMRSLWPLHRLFVRNRLSKRCARCLISEKQGPLQDGLCLFCLNDQAQKIESGVSLNVSDREQAFNDVVAKSNHPESLYDALVLFSGGKDSAYLLYRIRKQNPTMRILALTVDNGFMSPIAWKNINRIVGVFGVEHMVYRPASDFYKKLFRFAFINSGTRGCYEVVDRLGGDALHDIGRNIAARLGIPILMSGISPEQVERILGLETFESPSGYERQTRMVSAGFDLKDIFSKEERERYWWNGDSWPSERIPRVLFPFYAWGYDEDAIRSEMVALGLFKASNVSPLVTNSILIPLMGVIDVRRNGYSSFEQEFAGLVRSGKADRKRWISIFELLEYEAHSEMFLKKIIDRGLEKLELKRSDVGL